MSSPAELVVEARTRSGLSQRALAAIAGVEQSTIARIENGVADPAYSTVSRLVEAAGQHLAVHLTPAVPTLAEAVTDEADAEPDWTMLRAVIDHATRHPDDTLVMISAAPTEHGSALALAVAAGVAHKLARDANRRVPSWARGVKPLHEPWHAPGTPRMIERAKTESPPELARFNVFLRADALWRL
jgi:transcriptional regulator with XRE-family HTH domain